MTITVEATYENGVLRPKQPLALKEHEAVRITLHSGSNWVERTTGIMGFTGSTEEADYYALDSDLDPQED